MKLEPTKGTKDWYGKDAILRNKVRDTLRRTFESYGFNPIETPIIETIEVLGFKGGGEIQKEVFKVTDQGERALGLRFDQTVPLARFMASNPEIRLPFKRYVIGEVFRDGPTQPEQGRYRSFTQCDVDTLGVTEMTAEAELLYLANDAFKSLGLGGIEVNINNRKILDSIILQTGIPKEVLTKTVSKLDKLDKIGVEGVRSELLNLNNYDLARTFSNSTISTVSDLYGKELTDSAKSRILEDAGSKGLDLVSYLFEKKASRAEIVEKMDGFIDSGKNYFNEKAVNKLLNIIQKEDSNEKTLQKISNYLGTNEGLDEIEQVLKYTSELGFITFNPSLARGLDYYTGTTLEVFLQDKSILNSAILAGGRYDNMVGEYVGNEVQIPAVGMSFGLERNVMLLSNEAKMNVTDVMLIPLGDTKIKTLSYANMLRQEGLNVDTYQGNAKLGKAISFASKVGIPKVGIVGEEEAKSNFITIKDLETGKQFRYDLK